MSVSLVNIVERHVDRPRPPLDLADDVDHLVRVDPRFLGPRPHGGGLLHLLEVHVGHGWRGRDGLGLEVGHALGLAPHVQVAPPLLHRGHVKVAATRKCRLAR